MRVRTHPGEVLRYEYLEPLNMSAAALAEQIQVPANRLTDIIRGRRNVTAETAVLLAKFFDTTPTFWMNLQTAHDVSKAEEALAKRAKRTKPRPLPAKFLAELEAAKALGFRPMMMASKPPPDVVARSARAVKVERSTGHGVKVRVSAGRDTKRK